MSGFAFTPPSPHAFLCRRFTTRRRAAENVTLTFSVSRLSPDQGAISPHAPFRPARAQVITASSGTPASSQGLSAP